MRDIADKLGFSKTKVYDILHDANTSDNELFLRHNLVSNLNKAGITIREYADLVRSKNILVRRGIQTAKVLEIISKVIELCFRINLEPQLLASSFDNFSQFVSSIASKFGEDLQRRLEFELKYMENVLNDLDIVLDKCKQLRTQIDILERLASYQSNSMGKHS
jgi:hypothetical protein